MMKKSHVAIGLLSAALINSSFGYPLVFTLGGAVLGSLVPDWDLKFNIPHRSITHWLIWPILILYFWPGLWYGLAFGVGLGWLFHILADMLTVNGIRLWPTHILVRGPARTGSLSEYALVAPILLLLSYLLFKNIH
jgi:membrane-bound metal-dependent hydrolase YbcI (DUF457 family)